MKLCTTLVAAILLSVIVYSQEQQAEPVTNVFSISVFETGIRYEAKTGNAQSFLARAIVSPSIAIGFSSTFGYTNDVQFDPTLSAEYRFYYNGRRRAARGKRTAMNSMNYFSPGITAFFTKNPIDGDYLFANDRRTVYKPSLVWGFQRNYAGNFSLDISLGLGYLFGKDKIMITQDETKTIQSSVLTTAGHLSIGFWLNKRKKPARNGIG